jgi:hypothetical protein
VYLAIAAAIDVPILILAYAIYPAAHPTPTTVSWKAIWVELLAPLVVVAVARGVLIAAMSADYLGEDYDLGRAFARMRRRYITLLVASVLQWFAIVGGMILLFIPGLIVWIKTLCIECVAVLDERAEGGVSAFRRSWDLARNQESDIFLVGLLLALLGVIVGYGSRYLVSWAAGSIPAIESLRMQALITRALTYVALPIAPAIEVVLYYDLRIRNEGFDVETMSHALDRAPASG